MWLVSACCLLSASAQVILWMAPSPLHKQPASYIWITTLLVGEVVHEFSCFVCYVELNIQHQLMPFGCFHFTQRISLPHSWLPTTPTPIVVFVVLVYYVSKMVNNSDSYSFNSWCIDRLWIAIELWPIACKHLLSFQRCNTSNN